MMMMKMKKIAWLLSLVFVCTAATVSAQTSVVAPPGITEQISVHASPEKPQPNESVTVNIESFSTNLNKSYIVWSINGVVKEEGAGMTTFTFVSGKAGTVQNISIDITTEDKRTISHELSFAPAKVGLVIEADTYTPPFYKGKALFTPQSQLKVVAFPELVTNTGYEIPSENLVYTWKVDGKVMQSASGFGKSSFIMEGNLIPRSMYVTAEVSAYGSPLTAAQTIQVDPVEPEIVMYEDSLLYGIRRELGFTSGIYLPTKEIKLVAEPYYLSTFMPQSTDLVYNWTLNGQTVSSLTQPNVIGLENRSGEAGSATLGLTIEHLKKLLQAPAASLSIEFAATK
jgi:hypothetical protein